MISPIDRQNIRDLARILRRWDDDPTYDDYSNTYAVNKRTLKRARVLIGFIEQAAGLPATSKDEATHE